MLMKQGQEKNAGGESLQRRRCRCCRVRVLKLDGFFKKGNLCDELATQQATAPASSKPSSEGGSL